MANTKLNVTKIGYLEDNSFNANYLQLNIKGNNINEVIINVLRRIILEDIPCAAFDKKGINITLNTSVYNNDYMRNRIENLPLLGIETPLDLIQYEKLRKYTRGLSTYKNDDNIEEEEDIENSFNNILSIYCDIKNKNDVILDVTSEDVDFYKGEEKIKSIYEKPVLIIKLKPEEEFNFSAKASLGVGSNNAIFSNVGICCYEIINDKEFIFKFEPRGQLKSKKILSYACDIIKYRLNLIKEKIEKTAFSTNNNGTIILVNEDHTFGNLITRGLQEHQNIEFAGYKLENLLIKNINIEYVTNGGKSINNIFIEVINKYINIYDEFNKMFEKV